LWGDSWPTGSSPTSSPPVFGERFAASIGNTKGRLAGGPRQRLFGSGGTLANIGSQGKRLEIPKKFTARSLEIEARNAYPLELARQEGGQARGSSLG
jgi:hypothetical protein